MIIIIASHSLSGNRQNCCRRNSNKTTTWIKEKKTDSFFLLHLFYSFSVLYPFRPSNSNQCVVDSSLNSPLGFHFINHSIKFHQMFGFNWMFHEASSSSLINWKQIIGTHKNSVTLLLSRILFYHSHPR